MQKERESIRLLFSSKTGEWDNCSSLSLNGGYPIRSWTIGGVPNPVLDGGGSTPSSPDRGYPIQSWMGGTSFSPGHGGNPHPDLGPDLYGGTPIWSWDGGTPLQNLDWSTPMSGADLGWGTPCPDLGMGFLCPPTILTWEWGTPILTWDGLPPPFRKCE